jgi:hypothetical protein
MTFDPSAAIMRALMVTRPGAAAGGQQMAAGAPAKGFQPSSAPPSEPTAMGGPDTVSASPKGAQTQNVQAPPEIANQYTTQQAAPSGNMYDMLMSRLGQSSGYRAFQPTDFAPQQRPQYQFDPATDPSRIIQAKLAEQRAAAAAAAEAKAQATEPPPYDPYYAGGGHDSP